jgi:hypothetical protein
MFVRFLLIFFTLFFFLITNGWADPFLSYPGTRAKAMAGAFVAVADDSSACWYNPAGLAMRSTDFTIEFSQAPGLNEYREYTNNKTSVFLGIKGGDEKSGIGLFLYSPYHINYYFKVPDDSGYYDYISGYLDETLYIFGLAGAWGNEFLKFGITLEWVYLSFGNSTFYGYKSYWGSYDDIDIESLELSFGFSASLGILVHPLNLMRHGFDLKLGAVYRLPSGAHGSSLSYYEYEDTIKNKVIFKKPASYDVGVSTGVTLGRFVYVNLSAQYGEIDYSTANEYLDWKYQKMAGGGELRIALGKKSFLSFRGGAYYSKPSKDNILKVFGRTGGVALGLGLHFTIEASFEKRELEFPGNNADKISINLMSFSINWCY